MLTAPHCTRTRQGDWAAAHRQQERLIALFQIDFQGRRHTSMRASGVSGLQTAMQLNRLSEHRHMARPSRLPPDQGVTRIREIPLQQGLV